MNTRDLVKIKKVENSFFVLDDDTYCLIISIEGIQFFLMDEESKAVIIDQFKSFLNSLDFPLQFLVMTRYAKLDSYINYLLSFKGKQKNTLLELQLEDYISFIESLAGESLVMKRMFFAVVSVQKEKLRSEKEVLDTLFQRADLVLRFLSSMGGNPTILEGDELLNFIYNCYNPNEFYVNKIDSIKNLMKLIEGKT